MSEEYGEAETVHMEGSVEWVKKEGEQEGYK